MNDNTHPERRRRGLRSDPGGRHASKPRLARTLALLSTLALAAAGAMVALAGPAAADTPAHLKQSTVTSYNGCAGQGGVYFVLTNLTEPSTPYVVTVYLSNNTTATATFVKAPGGSAHYSYMFPTAGLSVVDATVPAPANWNVSKKDGGLNGQFNISHCLPGSTTPPSPKTPKLSTTATGAQLADGAATISDVAYLPDLPAAAGGSVTFTAYGPSDSASCIAGGDGNNVVPSPIEVNLDVDTMFSTSSGWTVPSGTLPVSAAGNYYWIASYSGFTDTANGLDYNSVHGNCGDRGETSRVTESSSFTPKLSTEADADGRAPNASISDVAFLPDLPADASGSVTFSVFGPSDGAACVPTGEGANRVGPPITVRLDAETMYTEGEGWSIPSGPVSVTDQGDYYWVASYSGDAAHKYSAVAGTCGDEDETSTVIGPRPLKPEFATVATDGILPPGSISDTAYLADLPGNATGTVTFSVFGPLTGNVNAESCVEGAQVGNSITVTLHSNMFSQGNGWTVPSGNVTVSQTGTYYWVASYSGDETHNYLAASGVCGDKGETSTVTQQQTTTTTTTTTTTSAVGPLVPPVLIQVLGTSQVVTPTPKPTSKTTPKTTPIEVLGVSQTVQAAPSANAHTGQGQSPWVYVLFGLGALLMLGAVWARRGNRA